MDPMDVLEIAAEADWKLSSIEEINALLKEEFGQAQDSLRIFVGILESEKEEATILVAEELMDGDADIALFISGEYDRSIAVLPAIFKRIVIDRASAEEQGS